jgi:hypothetical protein
LRNLEGKNRQQSTPYQLAKDASPMSPSRGGERGRERVETGFKPVSTSITKSQVFQKFPASTFDK